MSSPTAPTGAAPAMRFSPMTVVAVLCIGSLSGALMQSLVIPIQRELPELLHTSASNASWAVTATLLAGAVTMPVTGRLADMYGKKRVLLVSATLLVLAGALNGLILPFGFGILIWVALMRRDLLGGYRYPKVLAYVGLAVWLLTIYLGYESFSGILDLWEQ